MFPLGMIGPIASPHAEGAFGVAGVLSTRGRCYTFDEAVVTFSQDRKETYVLHPLCKRFSMPDLRI